MSVIYLAEIAYWDGDSVETLRYSSGNGFTTSASETPANQFFEPRIRNPASLKRNIFSAGKTYGASQVGYGDLELINNDGGLDALKDYGFDGRTITIRRGEHDAAYPAGFTTVLVGTMKQCHVGRDVVRIQLRDRQSELNIPLQETKYDGDNALPDGLEGTADDLKGKPKPVCYGVVKNVSPPCVNTSKLIYQVNDGEVLSVDRICDRGVDLFNIASPWTSQTHGLGGAADLRCAAFGNTSTWLVMGYSTRAYSTNDGVAWTTGTMVADGPALTDAVLWTGSVFIAVGCTSGVNQRIATSPDGITWTKRTAPNEATATTDFKSVAYGNGIAVTCGQQNQIAYSTDGGATWTQATSPWGGTPTLRTVSFGAGLFFIGKDSGEIATSPDGATWTTQTNVYSDQVAQSAYGAGRFIAMGGGAAVDYTRYGHSPDGKTWIGTATGMGNVETYSFGNGRFVAVGTGGKLATSIDGIVWTRHPSGTSADLKGSCVGQVVTGAAQAIAVGLGVVLTSPPGIDTTEYTSEAELLDDTLQPFPGSAKVYPAGGYFRLGSPPAGQITADVTQGANAAARTQAQIFTQIIDINAGMSSSDWNSTDITTHDTAQASVIGFWTDQEMTCAQAIDTIVSPGSYWFADRTGDYRIKQFLAATGSAVASFIEAEIKGLERVEFGDETEGIPVWRVILKYQKNHTVQTSDIAGGVTDARRAFLAKEWREAVDEVGSVQTAHPLSKELILESPFDVAANAATEADRIQTLRGTIRHLFEWTVQLTAATAAIDLGDVVNVTHSRFGLSAGADMRVIGLEPDCARNVLRITAFK